MADRDFTTGATRPCTACATRCTRGDPPRTRAPTRSPVHSAAGSRVSDPTFRVVRCPVKTRRVGEAPRKVATHSSHLRIAAVTSHRNVVQMRPRHAVTRVSRSDSDVYSRADELTC